MMRVLDLFSGIGGFSLGLERTGEFETVAFCEIDSFCRCVLSKHWPHVPQHADVTTREFHEGEADVITGGFPCQDISFAGPGAGIAGKRSGLYRELVRAIRVVRPLYAIVENVAALLNRGLGVVLGDLAEIGSDAEWHCIPASAVGARHRRDRVWIVAYPYGAERRQDAPSCRSIQWSDGLSSRQEGSGRFGAGREALADATSDGRGAWRTGDTTQEPGRWQSDRSGIGSDVADTYGSRLEVSLDGNTGKRAAAFGSGWQWASEPDVGRVAHGVPSRVDRLRTLGNAVVPQIPEIIGRALARALEARA